MVNDKARMEVQVNHVRGVKLKQMENFKYWNSTLTESGGCQTEVKESKEILCYRQTATNIGRDSENITDGILVVV